MSDHQDVRLTAGLQQGQGARIMAVVYSLVQSCFTILQHNFFKKGRLCLLDFNSVSFNLIYVDRPSDGIYHSLPVQEEEPGRSYHVSFPCQRWLSGRNSFPDTTVTAWRWAIHGATIQRWISPWAHTVEGHVCVDCLLDWLHPEYQSAAAADGWCPSGRYWQLSAGVCLQSGRGREGGKEGGREDEFEISKCASK